MGNVLDKSIRFCLILIAAVFLWNCENESIDIPVQETFKSRLSFDKFDSPSFLHSNFQVDWDNFEIHQKGSVDYYEFRVNYESGASFKFEGYAPEKFYSLLVDPSDKENIEFFLIVSLPLEGSKAAGPSFFNTSGFSGMQYIYSIKGETLSISRFEDGEQVEGFVDGTKSKSLKSGIYPDEPCIGDVNPRSPSQQGKALKSPCPGGGGGCGYEDVQTDHYVLWYEVETNNYTGAIVSVTYLYTEYVGTTTEYIYTCSGGGNSGSSQKAESFVPQVPEGIDPDEFLELIEGLDDQIIVELTGKAKCVYGKMGDNSILKNTLEKFKGENVPVHLIFEQESNLTIMDKNGNDILVNAYTQYGDSYNITIRLNTEQANNRPSLAVARTILHEAIHAEIYRKIKTTSGLSFDPSTNTWKFPNGSRANFPSLFDAYNEDTKNPYHNYMAKYYREALEHGLREYAKATGASHPDQFYKDMAWYGLLDTKAWENQYADKAYAEREKNRIINASANFEKSGINECK